MISSRRSLSSGFTLIELLVVIAIIGILSSVVLASVNTARNKGADASVKSNLEGTRANAEIYYDLGLTYAGVCATSGTNKIGNAVNAAERAYSGSAVTTYANATASTWNTAQCHDSGSAWAAMVPLKASTNASPLAFCVDNTGAAKVESTMLAASTFACP